MPNGDPRDGFFYPTLTLMTDSFILTSVLFGADYPHLLHSQYREGGVHGRGSDEQTSHTDKLSVYSLRISFI